MSMAEIHAGMLAQERNRQNDRRERRDQFAAAFVTGMCAAPESEYALDRIVELAAEYSGKLLAALDGTEAK